MKIEIHTAYKDAQASNGISEYTVSTHDSIIDDDGDAYLDFIMGLDGRNLVSSLGEKMGYYIASYSEDDGREIVLVLPEGQDDDFEGISNTIAFDSMDEAIYAATKVRDELNKFLDERYQKSIMTPEENDRRERTISGVVLIVMLALAIFVYRYLISVL